MPKEPPANHTNTWAHTHKPTHIIHEQIGGSSQLHWPSCTHTHAYPRAHSHTRHTYIHNCKGSTEVLPHCHIRTLIHKFRQTHTCHTRRAYPQEQVWQLPPASAHNAWCTPPVIAAPLVHSPAELWVALHRSLLCSLLCSHSCPNNSAQAGEIQVFWAQAGDEAWSRRVAWRCRAWPCTSSSSRPSLAGVAVWHLSTPQHLLYLLHQPPCHGQHVHASGKRPVKICALDSIILHILPGATAARQRGTLFAGAHEATRGMPHEGSGAMAHGTAGYGRLWRREVQCACGV